MTPHGEQRATLIDRHSSMEDCWRVVTTAERTGTVFMLMEQVRFSGYIRAWRRIVDAAATTPSTTPTSIRSAWTCAG